MKLRIQGNSLRLRVSQTDVRRLIEDGSIESTIQFAPGPSAAFTYVLAHRRSEERISAAYSSGCVTVWLSTEAAATWAASDAVGIYGISPAGVSPLELIVEKDFACLDGADAPDPDAFPNPQGSC